MEIKRRSQKEPSGWNFHHSQKMHRKRDGSLDVAFTACGLSEMAWRLITWDDNVNVIKPKALIKEPEKNTGKGNSIFKFI